MECMLLVNRADVVSPSSYKKKSIGRFQKRGNQQRNKPAKFGRHHVADLSLRKPMYSEGGQAAVQVVGAAEWSVTLHSTRCARRRRAASII